MRRLILCLLLVPLLGGCAEADKPIDTPLAGASLEQCGYTVKIPDRVFDGEYLLNFWGSAYTNNAPNTYSFDVPIDGDYTIVVLWFWVVNGMSPQPIMYLQAYETAAIAQNPVITVDNIGYRATGLEALAVYADDTITVFDFYPLLSNGSFEEWLKREIALVNSSIERDKANPPYEGYEAREPLKIEDYHYLLLMNDYFRENIGDMIEKIHSKLHK